MNDREKAEIILEALRDLHSNETFERAIGRYVRNHKGDYEEYIKLISEIRKLSQKKKVTLLKAAERLAKSYES
ncbi:MAG: hypothetical protein V3U51_06005 [Thermoplasmata archaeon]